MNVTSSQSEEKIIIHMNMCSNSGSGCGCGSGGGHGNGNGNSNDVSIWSSSLKKQQQQQPQQQKRPRIPKRGPGVAELEKILRQQESIDLTTNDRGINNEGFSVSSSHLFPHFSSSRLKSHQPLPPPPPPPQQLNSSNFPFASKFDHVMPPTIGSMCGNGNGNSSNTHSLLGRNGGGGSGEHELYPRNLNFSSCKSKPNLNEAADGCQSDSGNSPSSDSNHANWNYTATIQKRNNGYPPQPMVRF
jgi:hypothetical protein